MSDTTLIKYLGEEGTSALIDKIRQILSHKPDFAQNDPTHSDYIKNRTHWMDYELEELLTSVTVDIEEGGESAYETDITLVEGEKYVVEFEDKNYICTAKTFIIPDDTGTITYIGNDMLTNGINSNDYPFTLCTINIPGMEGVMIIAMVDMSTGEILTSTQFTFSLGHLAVKEVHKLDSRYIDSPDWNAKKGEAGHILNRTHYTYDNYILPLTTFDLNEDAQAYLSAPFNFEEDKTYFVNYNGTEYECVGSRMILDGMEMTYIGDYALSNLPFTITDIPEGIIENVRSVINTENYASGQVTISIHTSDYKKLDNRFLDLDWLPLIVEGEEIIVPTEIITRNGFINGLAKDMINVGETYVVYFNGKPFRTVAKSCEYYDGSYTTVVYLGNGSFCNHMDGSGATTEQEDTGEDFCILISEFLQPILSLKDGVDYTEVILSIAKPIKTPNKLPNEYLDMDWYASDVVKEEELVPVHEIVGDVHMFVDGVNELPEIIVGQTYNVYINDTCYKCTAVKDKNDCICLGNLSLAGLGENTKEPFYVCYTPEGVQGGNSMYYDRFKRGDTVRITKPYSEPNKLPSKYLPDDFVKGVSAFYVIVTANEDGTFSADKTFAEISEAHEAGKLLYCNLPQEGIINIPLHMFVSDEACIFAVIANKLEIDITILSDDTVGINIDELATLGQVPEVDTALDRVSYNAINNRTVTRKFEEVDTALTNRYLKSETYSQSEVNSLLSSIPKFSISVVSSLPTTNISNTTVYLVPSDEEEHDLYTEYIYVNNKWETLGRQKMDLSGFVTKEEVKNHTQVQIIRWEEND